MKYSKKGGKYIFEEDGLSFPLTPDQCGEMLIALVEIQKIENPVWMCVVDGEAEPIDTCVWDEGSIDDCTIASAGTKKENCPHWKAI